MIDVADRLAICELLSLYGHLIDEHAWDRMDEVFTHDLVFDASDFGSPVTTSRAELVESWRRPETAHPRAHHSTNVVITADASDGTVRVLSKGIGVGPRGRVGSVTYRDVVRRTPDGWRLARRTAVLVRPQDA